MVEKAVGVHILFKRTLIQLTCREVAAKRRPLEWMNSGCFPASDGQLGCRDGPRMVVSLAACLELCQRRMTTLTSILEGTSCPSRYSLT